jgi:hypothetical protein
MQTPPVREKLASEIEVVVVLLNALSMRWWASVFQLLDEVCFFKY